MKMIVMFMLSSQRTHRYSAHRYPFTVANLAAGCITPEQPVFGCRKQEEKVKVTKSESKSICRATE
jgi:hypothetical protein